MRRLAMRADVEIGGSDPRVQIVAEAVQSEIRSALEDELIDVATPAAMLDMIEGALRKARGSRLRFRRLDLMRDSRAPAERRKQLSKLLARSNMAMRDGIELSQAIEPEYLEDDHLESHATPRDAPFLFNQALEPTSLPYTGCGCRSRALD